MTAQPAQPNKQTGLAASWSPETKVWTPENYGVPVPAELQAAMGDQPQPAPAPTGEQSQPAMGEMIARVSSAPDEPRPPKPAHKTDLAQRMAKRFASRESQNIIHEQLTLVADGHTRNWWRSMTKAVIGRECAIESLTPGEATQVITHLKDIRKAVGNPGQRFSVTFGAKTLYRQVEPADKSRREKEYAEYLRRESLKRTKGRTNSVHCLTVAELVEWSLALQKMTSPTAPVAPAQLPAPSVAAMTQQLGDGSERRL